MKFAKTYYSDWNRFTLITPADKSENVSFYTEKCGFDLQSTEMDGTVKVVRFVLDHEEGGYENVEIRRAGRAVLETEHRYKQ